MKKYSTASFTATFALIFSFIFSSCVKDSCQRTYAYTIYNPVYETRAGVKANIKSNTAKEVQNPGKLYIFGNYIFLNEIDKGIHIIDNSNPASPKNVAFIDIPGNLDMAVKGNILYADLYADLVTIDITDPLNVVVKKYNERIFPYHDYGNNFSGDSTKVIVDWIKKDTTVTVNCGGNQWWKEDKSIYFMANASAGNAGGGTPNISASPIGIGGSMARFAIANNRLYAVSKTDLNIFNISSPGDPAFSKKINISSSNIETIFPFKDNLFIGSQNGMFIYNINNPDNPVQAGQFAHVRSCDPVIADNNYAYVTLRAGTTCGSPFNELDILQLNNLTNPQLLKTYNFTNPHGLSKDGNLLFICDGKDGLKIYDASNVMNLQLIKQISNLETFDVVAYNNIALVVAKDGLYQFNYSNMNDIRLISRIGISK